MGHERLGLLPKTKRWRAIVAEIASLDALPSNVPEVARHTLKALGSRYVDLASDKSVEAAFCFLVDVARAAAGRSASVEVAGRSPLSLAAEVATRVAATDASLETSEIVRRAASDAVATWSREYATTQSELFTDPVSRNPWRGLGTGAGFCELSRLFFARLTERYLNYFLDREASAALHDFEKREQFRRQLQQHVGDVSKHSFETAKITQSYSAGWFNKHAVKDPPSETDVRRFLAYAFAKLREDLQRELRQ